MSAPIRDDGGPAYPWGEHGAHLGGMTLRDRFALEAMPKLNAFPTDLWNLVKWSLGCSYEVRRFENPAAAKAAYAQADAMLEARK